jgi:hypothetical protein
LWKSGSEKTGGRKPDFKKRGAHLSVHQHRSPHGISILTAKTTQFVHLKQGLFKAVSRLVCPFGEKKGFGGSLSIFFDQLT